MGYLKSIIPSKQRIYCVITTISLCATFASAQKRPLTFDDFNSWRTLTGQVLSRDGHYLAYGLFPQEGDGEVIIRDLATGKEWHEDAGQLPPPPPDDPNSEGPALPRSIQLIFSNDSKTLVFLAYPKQSAVEKAKTDKRTRAQEELVVFDLTAGKSSRVPDVKSFQLPKKSDGFVAYLKYPPASSTPTEGKEQEAKPTPATRGALPPAREFGSPLILRTLADQTERQIPDVLEYELTKDGKTLAYSVASPKAETDGVFTIATTGGDSHEVITGKGRYEHLSWDDNLDELAFIGKPSETTDAKKPPYNLYLWKTMESKAVEVVSSSTTGFHPGFQIHEHATLTFSKDGTRLFFGAAPPPPPPHATAIDEDKPSFDLWNYKDDYIQPIEKVHAPADLNRSFRAVYLIPQHKMLQLADESLSEVVPNEEGRYALGTDDREYRSINDYGERISDSYLVDVETGKRTLILKKHEGTVRWSGDGHYPLLFNGKDWITIAASSGKLVNLTEKLPVKFWNEEEDTPGTPTPYGAGGWTKDDKYVLLYDHYDVWQIAPDGSSAINLTQGMGREENLQFRYMKLDPEERQIDPSKPLLLRAENTTTRDSSFYSSRIETKEQPSLLTMSAKDFGTPIKAADANIYAVTAQTFSQFPDLLTTDASFKNLHKVSDANPQQANLLWGTAEMVSFENSDGVPLQGILYKPENFDPHKKYPMLVYLYERLSQNLNHFVDPKPMDSINISYYVSNGYLVFTPDIVYTTGYPGQSALKCVLGGVNTVVARGFVDEKNIGIQGHSWGGYQIAYMVTQTNRFKAAEDGAPVANMISAYDGIRWGTGRPRQFQYEKTQSRIGGTPWEYPLRFIENSPIFMADRIQTPILIIHNDADDAVPWYQGIEFFLALRRLNKEAYMFTYNGEPHHLHRRANQKDYAVRLAQYFDYELKVGPKPAWMEKGIPYLHTAEQVKP
jgi:dipeptidyl aminopeptidase/acylaminoacyl peptidase